MAITLGDAILYLRSDDRDLDSGLSGAEKKTTGWAKGLGGKIGPLIGGAVVGGVTLAVGAIAGISTKAFNVADEVNQATKQMQASLGLTAEEAENLGQVGLEVFGNNFAGSITEAVDAVGLVRQQLGGLAEAGDFQRITEDAFRLQDAFGVDVAESISAARTLMENFGLDSQEAFDLITTGFQRGLNRSDDFIDTIEEYSTQFASGGATANSFFGLLESGLAGGALGTDKAADAFKEFRVRIQDGSDATAEGLALLGKRGEQLAEGLAEGSIDAAFAFGEVVYALGKIEDPAQRIQAGVALLGTQFEDLGDAALGLSLIGDNFDTAAGATESLNAQYETLGAAFEGYKRQFLVALAPVGEKLLELANDAMPSVQRAFEWMSTTLPGIIDSVVTFIDKGVGIIKRLFNKDLPSSLGVSVGAFGIVKDWIDENMPLIRQTVQKILGAITNFWERHGDAITRIVGNFMRILELTFGTALRNILDLFKVILQLINGDVEGAGETLKEIGFRTMQSFFWVISLWLDSIKTLFTDIRWGELGASIVHGIIAGLQGAWHLLRQTLTGLAQGAVEGVKDWLLARSPSKRTANEIGVPMAQGIVMGLEDEIRRIMPRLQMNLAMNPAMAAAGANIGPTTINVYESGTPHETAQALSSLLNRRRQRGV